MITLEKILFLRQVPLFENIPSAELARIAEVTDEVVVPAGDYVFREGEFGESLFVIADGRILISRDGVALARLSNPSYFGEMSLFDGEPRSASAKAETDALLLCIGQKDFHGILRRHFDAALGVIRTLSRRLREQMGQHGGQGDRR